MHLRAIVLLLPLLGAIGWANDAGDRNKLVAAASLTCVAYTPNHPSAVVRYEQGAVYRNSDSDGSAPSNSISGKSSDKVLVGARGSPVLYRDADHFTPGALRVIRDPCSAANASPEYSAGNILPS